MKYKKGEIVKGIVTGIENYGAFVSFDEFYTGLIHISEISHGYVKNINDFIEIGDYIYVKILDIDEETEHLTLSIKNINYKVNGKMDKHFIVETESGFSTLALKLPYWINEKLKSNKKAIDK